MVVHHVGEHLNGAGVVENVGAREEANSDLVDLFRGGRHFGRGRCGERTIARCH